MRIIKLQSKLKFINAIESNFRVFFTDVNLLPYKIKHDVFSDVTGQKYLHFSQMSYLDGSTNLQRKCSET